MQVTFTGSVDLDDIITVSALKEYLRVDHSDEDSLITSFRAVAVNFVEDYTNTKLGSRTATGYLDYFTNSVFPVAPVTSITGVVYDDINGSEQNLAAGSYYFDKDSDPARIRFHNVPSLEEYALARVRITFTFGYTSTEVPPPIVQAVRMLVAHYYENRAAVTQSGVIPRSLQLGVESLLSPYRSIRVV